MRPEGHPLSTHGPGLKDCDCHLSVLVSAGDVCPSPACLSPAAEPEPRATMPSCTAQHRPSHKIPLFFRCCCCFFFIVFLRRET